MKPVCRRAYITSSMVMGPTVEPQFRVIRASEWFRSLVRLRLGSTWPKRAADNVKRVHQELGGKSP